MGDGLNDRQEQSHAKRREVLARRQARKDLEAVTSTPAGRRFIWRQLLKTNVFGDDYATDQRDHARASGYRSYGVELLEEVQRASPANYFHMLNEQFASSAKAKARQADKDE